MSFTTIRSKLRNLINENYKSGTDVFTFTSSRVFSLSEEHIGDVSEVYVNDEALGESGAGWSYSTTSNKVTLSSSASLSAGDTIQIDYTFYPNYSNDELDAYIKGSFAHIAVNQYKTFEVNDDDINPEPTEAEENLIALVAAIMIKPDNKSYRLPELSVNVPFNSLSTNDMIQKVIASFKKNCHGIFAMIDNSKII